MRSEVKQVILIFLARIVAILVDNFDNKSNEKICTRPKLSLQLSPRHLFLF